MYSDLNCFSCALTLSFISFSSIALMSISVVLMHFSVIAFSFAGFIIRLTYLKTNEIKVFLLK